MRASKLIKVLEEMIKENGDCYVTHASEGEMYGMEKVNEVEVIPHFETKYFCFK